VPSSVRSLFAGVAVPDTELVPWGTRIPPPEDVGVGTGLYMVALTDELDSTKGAAPVCPLARAAVQKLLAVRQELTLDGERPDADALGVRLAAFWCPDEVVVYIGLAGPRQHVTVSELSDRVAEYYTTGLGARSPHAGGWPLKTLADLNSLYVHFAYCDDVVEKERLMLEAFAGGVSDETRAALYDTTHVMPFANLEDGQGRRKAHGIKGATAPRVRGRREGDPFVDAPAVPRIDKPRAPLAASSSTASLNQTQRITAGDIQRGIIRIPGPAKVLFPPERTQVEIELRGERKSCRWDPRHGPDQARSGVLGIGTALSHRLVVERERLRIQVEDGVIFLA
jgi:hypothetical protein